MKSLIQYIYELKDETYLNLARKRKEQNKDVSNIISHSKNKIYGDFIKELTSTDWYKSYVKKIEYNELSIRLVLDESMRENSSKEYEKYKDDRKAMYDTLKKLAKKYGRLIHGYKFDNIYANEEPAIIFYMLDRNDYLKDINSDTILYHVTSDLDKANNIIKNGIIPHDPHFATYTYNCVFAFKSKKFIELYRKKYLQLKKYYIIEFKAGNNIYFNDWMLNKDLLNELRWKSPGYDLERLKKQSSESIFTLSNINKDQIVSIIEVDGKNKKTIYTNKK